MKKVGDGRGGDGRGGLKLALVSEYRRRREPQEREAIKGVGYLERIRIVRGGGYLRVA